MTKEFSYAVAISLLLLAGSLAADAESEAIADDCRTEGEAASLSDDALEKFVRECVEELGGIDYGNPVEAAESEPGQ